MLTVLKIKIKILFQNKISKIRTDFEEPPGNTFNRPETNVIKFFAVIIY